MKYKVPYDNGKNIGNDHVNIEQYELVMESINQWH